MASILRVDTLTDASSNNSTPMATVNQGTAKFWVKWNGTGTAAASDSFNSSTLTDNGTGLTTFTFSTNMGNVNYSLATTNSSVEANNSQTNFNTATTSTIKMETRSGTAADLLTDTSQNFGQINGDSA